MFLLEALCLIPAPVVGCLLWVSRPAYYPPPPPPAITAPPPVVEQHLRPPRRQYQPETRRYRQAADYN